MPNRSLNTVIHLYNLLLYSVALFAFPLAVLNVLFSRKRRKTALYRLGLASYPDSIREKPTRAKPRRVIWVHALSVGEVLSAGPLVVALKETYADWSVHFTVSTLSGFEIAKRQISPRVDALSFFPYDFPFSVKRIADRIAPDIVLLVETDIWPNFLFEMKGRKIPVIFVNARLSDRSFSGYRRMRYLSRPVFRSLFRVCVQTAEDAERFRSLGVSTDRIRVTGNLKFDRDSVSMIEKRPDDLKRQLAIDPRQRILLAGSTHPGEESIIKDAYLLIKKRFPDLFLIVVPRNPDRAPAIQRELLAAGLHAALWSARHFHQGAAAVETVVVDTIGMLKELYGAADIAFVGGSLVNRGGHNPLEPAAFAKPILFGPDMSDFKEIAGMLLESGGAKQVSGPHELRKAVEALLEDPRRAKDMGASALRLFRANRGAVEKTVKIIDACLTYRYGEPDHTD